MCPRKQYYEYPFIERSILYLISPGKKGSCVRSPKQLKCPSTTASLYRAPFRCVFFRPLTIGYFSGTNIERKVEEEREEKKWKRKTSFIFVEWDLFDFESHRTNTRGAILYLQITPVVSSPFSTGFFRSNHFLFRLFKQFYGSN